MTPTLERWNTLDANSAEAEILPCNGSQVWAAQMAEQRPFASETDLLAAADAVWAFLPAADWQQAFDSHPRLGQRHAAAATKRSLAWSAGEQSGICQEEEIAAALAEANRRYEEQFGRIFLLCATGKTASEVLSQLGARLGQDPETELREAAEQQRRITQLRLRKWLGLAAAHCEDV